MNTRALLLTTALLTLQVLPALADDSESSLRFRVLLDQRPIGEHRFDLRTENGATEVSSQADFRIRFLFLDVYRYQHTARERWRGNCLEAMDAKTDDNGDRESVLARSDVAGLTVTAGARQQRISGCVRSFAYWNPTLLESGRLLNAQTGEYLPVQVQALGEEFVTVSGRRETVRRYRLSGKDLAIDLWYRRDQQWVALESNIDQRRLRYERM